MLLTDKKDFLQNKSTTPGDRLHYCNSPLKIGQQQDKDLFIVSERVWKFLQQRYRGEEIKRYAIYKNQVGLLDRQPGLPMVSKALKI
jgi:DUSP domain